MWTATSSPPAMVAAGDADAMVTGLTRSYPGALSSMSGACCARARGRSSSACPSSCRPATRCSSPTRRSTRRRAPSSSPTSRCRPPRRCAPSDSNPRGAHVVLQFRQPGRGPDDRAARRDRDPAGAQRRLRGRRRDGARHGARPGRPDLLSVQQARRNGQRADHAGNLHSANISYEAIRRSSAGAHGDRPRSWSGSSKPVQIASHGRRRSTDLVNMAALAAHRHRRLNDSASPGRCASWDVALVLSSCRCLLSMPPSSVPWRWPG